MANLARPIENTQLPTLQCAKHVMYNSVKEREKLNAVKTADWMRIRITAGLTS